MPVSQGQQPVFRCKKCGHLEAADHAGENAVPCACSCCGAGVEFDKTGIRTFLPDNWEVLDGAKTKSSGSPPVGPGNSVSVSTQESPKSKNKA